MIDDDRCPECGSILPIYGTRGFFYPGPCAECAAQERESRVEDELTLDLDWDPDDIDRNVANLMEIEDQKSEIVNWLSASRFVVTSGKPAARVCYSCKSHKTRYKDGRWRCVSCGVTWVAKGPPRWNHFLVHSGIRARRSSGDVIDLFDWLLNKGIQGGVHIDGWRVIQFQTRPRQMLVFCRVDGSAHDDGVGPFSDAADPLVDDIPI